MALRDKGPSKTSNRTKNRDNNSPSVTEPAPDPIFNPNSGGGVGIGRDEPEVMLKQNTNTRRVTQLRSLSQVNHGLKFVAFDPNDYYPTDLFTASSPLRETTKEDADRAVEKIEKQRQTMRVVGGNIQLAQDLTKAAIDYQKLMGLAIGYADERVKNQTRYFNFQSSSVLQQTAQVKYEQALEGLQQAEYKLSGMKEITPLVLKEWEAKVTLQKASIQDLVQSAYTRAALMNEKLNQLSSDFQNDMANL